MPIYRYRPLSPWMRSRRPHLGKTRIRRIATAAFPSRQFAGDGQRTCGGNKSPWGGFIPSWRLSNDFEITVAGCVRRRNYTKVSRKGKATSRDNKSAFFSLSPLGKHRSGTARIGQKSSRTGICQPPNSVSRPQRCLPVASHIPCAHIQPIDLSFGASSVLDWQTENRYFRSFLWKNDVSPCIARMASGCAERRASGERARRGTADRALSPCRKNRASAARRSGCRARAWR